MQGNILFVCILAVEFVVGRGIQGDGNRYSRSVSCTEEGDYLVVLAARGDAT